MDTETLEIGHFYDSKSQEICFFFVLRREGVSDCLTALEGTTEGERGNEVPGGTPLYGLYRYVRPQRAWFFSRSGNK